MRCHVQLRRASRPRIGMQPVRAGKVWTALHGQRRKADLTYVQGSCDRLKAGYQCACEGRLEGPLTRTILAFGVLEFAMEIWCWVHNLRRDLVQCGQEVESWDFTGQQSLLYFKLP
jgi:hypothetical protein